jgi:N-acetyl-anhydromuramyl-L-alanine amidase AmpD
MNFKQRESTDFIAIHCSATQGKSDVGVTEIKRWHRERGFLDIGYHFVIRRNGVVEIGRHQEAVGAHVEGFNSTSVAICMVGGVDSKMKPEDNFTKDQYAALLILVKKLKADYPKAVVLGHRDFPKVAKACPSFSVPEWVKANGI